MLFLPWPSSDPSEFLTLSNKDLLHFSTIFLPKNSPSCCPSIVFSNNCSNSILSNPSYLLSTQKKVARDTIPYHSFFSMVPPSSTIEKAGFLILRIQYHKISSFSLILPSFFFYMTSSEAFSQHLFFFSNVDTSNPKWFLLYLTCHSNIVSTVFPENLFWEFCRCWSIGYPSWVKHFS